MVLAQRIEPYMDQVRGRLSAGGSLARPARDAPDSQCSRVHPELHRLVAVPFCQPCETVRPRPRDDRVEAEMRVYIWSDGAAMPNGGPAGAGYVVVGGVRLLGSDALGDATNNVAEYTAVRNALRAAADAGATSAHVRMDSPVVFGHLSGASRARAEHLIQLKEEVEAQVARYPGRVTFARIPRERNGVADELAKDGARASKALSADRRR